MMDLSSIKNASILEGLDQADLSQLAAIASEKETRKGERLFTRGEQATTFYVAIRGGFALTLSVREFDEPHEMVVEEKRALDAFGWSSLVEPSTSIYSAYCTAAGAVAAFPGDELRQLIATNQRLGYRLSSNLNALIGARVRAVQDLWIGEVEQSHARVDYWTHSELTTRLQRVVEKSSPASTTVWQKLTRSSHSADRH